MTHPVRLRVSEVFDLEETLCAGCLHYERDEESFDQCYILASLGAEGESDCVVSGDKVDPETGTYLHCRMRRPRHEWSIAKWVAEASTEEAKEMYDTIDGSYHHQVFERIS